MLAATFIILVIFAMWAGATAAYVQHDGLLRDPVRYWRHKAMLMRDENVRFGMHPDSSLPGDTWCSWSERMNDRRRTERRATTQRHVDDLVLQARRVSMTDIEREAQRRSFVYGNCVIDNPRVTRQMVNEVADEMDAASRDARSAWQDWDQEEIEAEMTAMRHRLKENS